MILEKSDEGGFYRESISNEDYLSFHIKVPDLHVSPIKSTVRRINK
jgi:hypothetical protein